MAKGIKTGGRMKGSPNKKSELLSEALDSLKFNLPLRLAEIFPKLTPDKQMDCLLELLQYLYPKRKAIEVDENENAQSQMLTAILNRPMSSQDRTARIDELRAKIKTGQFSEEN